MKCGSAYLKASYEVEDAAAKAAYRKKAELTLPMQLAPTGPDAISLELVEQQYQQELAEADHWYQELEQAEQMWISQGMDPEEEFARTYYSDPKVTFRPEPARRRTDAEVFSMAMRASAIGVATLLLLLVLGIVTTIYIVCLRATRRDLLKPVQ